METYQAEFHKILQKNLRQLENQLDAENDKLVKSARNTCLFAKALHNTFSEIGDVASMLAMSAACDYSPINQ